MILRHGSKRVKRLIEQGVYLVVYGEYAAYVSPLQCKSGAYPQMSQNRQAFVVHAVYKS